MAITGGGKILNGKHVNLSETSGRSPKKMENMSIQSKDLPLANLWLQMRALGLQADRYADSTGVVKQLLT